LRKHPQLILVFALVLAASASTWFYMNHILRSQQIADASAHNVPRGNLSDLYPRWLGAHELLLRGRNPYSPEITREIQQGYYGRPLDPKRPNDPKDRQDFAYPVYVVFLLAPTIGMPFAEVQTGFRWLLIALAVASVFLWLRLLRWRLACTDKLILAVLMLGWLPMVQGIKLQQLSLLVAGLLAACGACLSAGWYFTAGGLLALATVKPQLAWPFVLWLLLWAGSDWRARRRAVWGSVLVMLLLLGGAELILPGWWRMFFEALRQYHQYTQNKSVMVWMFGPVLGRILEALCFLVCAVCVWRMRREPATSAAFGRATALVLALTVLIVPMFAPYNQVLLAPAILSLAWSESRRDPVLPVIRLARIMGGLLLVWAWIATIVLSAAYPWLTPQLRATLWPMPFFSNFLVPIFIFGLALLHSWSGQSPNLRERAAQE